MCAGMEFDRTPCHPTLQLPTQSEVDTAHVYSKRCFQRILCSWVQDLLERRRLGSIDIEIAHKRAA